MQLKLLKSVALAVLVCGMAGAASAAPAPQVSISSFAQLPTPLPYPYDEKADANADVAAAKARAKAEHKLLAIDLGGNWCGDCRVLAGTMELPEVKAFDDAHYVVVLVDVGRFNRNQQIPAHYGVTRRLEGVPVRVQGRRPPPLPPPAAVRVRIARRSATPLLPPPRAQ